MNNIRTMLPEVKFRFNIDHPSIEECYSFGYECAQAQLDEIDNPFDMGSEEHYQWLEGWWAGFYGEKPLFDLSNPEKELRSEPAAAANDLTYQIQQASFLSTFLKITGVLAATAIVGYQVFDLVA